MTEEYSSSNKKFVKAAELLYVHNTKGIYITVKLGDLNILLEVVYFIQLEFLRAFVL